MSIESKRKERDKVRANRLTIDDKMLGDEPAWNPGDVPENESERRIEYARAFFYYNHFKNADLAPYAYRYAKEELGFSDDVINSIKNMPDWGIVLPLGKVSKIFYRGWKYTDEEIAAQKKRVENLYKDSLKYISMKEDEPKTPVVPVAEKLKMKIDNTIALDWDKIVDGWINGDYKQEFNVYNAFKVHGLKPAACNTVEEMVRKEYNVLYDAYHKKCEQAIEAYNHITRSFQKKMLQLMEGIFADLESIKTAAKQTKIPRTKKVKASDKQVAKLKYKTEDNEFKLVSINPVMIPGQTRLFVYNTKTRKLAEYQCSSVGGFLIQGSSIKNFDQETSRIATIRKPDEILPLVMKKTPKQLDKLWDSVTTKITQPNGRINEDCILMRVFK